MVFQKSTTPSRGRLAGLLLVALGGSVPAAAHAASFACTAGDTACLVGSIAAANTNGHAHNRLTLAAGVYPVVHPVEHTFDGANAFPTITAPLLVLQAVGGPVVLVRTAPAPLLRFFLVAAGAELILNGVTLQGGAVSGALAQDGGCVLNYGTLRSRNSLLRECEARNGGAIRSEGILEVEQSACEDNLALNAGGCIAADGPATDIRLSLFRGNTADAYGALIVVGLGEQPAHIRTSTFLDNHAFRTNGGAIGTQGTVTITETFCDGNSAGTRGGCVFAHAGTLTLRRMAIIHNTSEAFGGGVALESAGGGRGPDVTLRATQIVGNTVRFGGGGGLHNPNDVPILVQRSLITGNSSLRAPDCLGPVTLVQSRVGDPTGCTLLSLPE